MRFLFLVTGLAFLFSACDMLTAISLKDTKWILQAYELPGQRPVSVHRSDYYIIFLSDGGVSGSAACNSCGGRYEVDGGKISISFACTKIGCPNDLHGRAFHAGLGEAFSYEIKGRRFTLIGEDGTTLHLRAR